MLLKEYAESYYEFLKIEKGLAYTTQKGYKASLNAFLRWLESSGYDNPILSDFNTLVLRRYLHHLSNRQLRPRTIISKFDPIHGLGVFLVTSTVLESNPCTPLMMPKKDAAVRLTVSNEEIRTMLQAVERIKNGRRRIMARAVLHILVFGGLRRAEVCDLMVSDVDKEQGGILVRSGKGNKSRKIFLPANSMAAVGEWIAMRGEINHNYLFCVDKRRRLYFAGLAELVEEIKYIAGYGGAENIKPHSLRHWRATDLLRSGTDLKTIQTFLGHTMLQTTAVYLHADEEQVKSVRESTTLS